MRVLHVVGARPNFMKVAPVMAAIAKKDSASQVLVHTGQHYDANMSQVFFKQLGLPEPDIDLEVGSGSHAYQTAQVMMRMESVLLEKSPGLVLVYGDVNSTAAAAIVCSKLLIPVGHVEAGLRSFDRTMPEEINRVITDQISDLLFTPSKDADENLLCEGIARDKIHFVGNVMIDTLVRLQESARNQNTIMLLKEKNLFPSDLLANGYGLVTLHRPSNVDDFQMLVNIVETLQDISKGLPIVFPVHPRTRHHLNGLKFKKDRSKLWLIEPVGYLEFLLLQKDATLVITDSGGIQEESTFLGVPCLTVRENTERPVTTDVGTNTLVGQDMNRLKTEVHRILNGNGKKGKVPPLWDGRAAERIAAVISGWSQ